MRWIEEIFGISPDGGSGATELAILLAVAAAVIIAGLFLRAGVTRRRRRSR